MIVAELFLCVCPRGERAGAGREAARKRGTGRRLTGERPVSAIARRAREEMPPPQIGVGYGSHVEEWGEKDDPYGLIALIKIKWTDSLPSGEGGGRAGWA